MLWYTLFPKRGSPWIMDGSCGPIYSPPPISSLPQNWNVANIDLEGHSLLLDLSSPRILIRIEPNTERRQKKI